MNKRKFAWAATIFVAVFCLAGALWCVFGSATVTMSQQELQDKIDAKIPHTTTNGVTVSAVKLDLSDNKIGIGFEASATKLKTDFAVKAQTKGQMRYNNADGSFYFAPEVVHLEDVKVNSSSVADTVGNLVNKLTPKRLEEEKAKLAKKGAELLDSVIQSGAEMTLERMPVYKLKNDFKGVVVKMVLEKVEVRDGNVIAHLSFWQFTRTVISFIATFVLCVVIAIVLLLTAGGGGIEPVR